MTKLINESIISCSSTRTSLDDKPRNRQSFLEGARVSSYRKNKNKLDRSLRDVGVILEAAGLESCRNVTVRASGRCRGS